MKDLWLFEIENNVRNFPVGSFCPFCFDKREKGVFSWKKSMSVILRSFSGASQLTWTCLSQKEHKMSETVHTSMGILKTESFWTQKFFTIVTILSQSFSNIQKLQILNFLITFVFWNETHKSPKYVRNSQFLMNNEKTWFWVFPPYGCFAG